jgi:hypothetical protein
MSNVGTLPALIQRAAVDFDTPHLRAASLTEPPGTAALGCVFRGLPGCLPCALEVIPSQQRIETVADEADLEDVYNTERQLLYVACTRARDRLLVTSVTPASEFLDDLRT